MRIDEALRLYLSEFRLPGEAPLISSLLEHFAAHWRVKISFFFLKKSNEFLFLFFKNKGMQQFSIRKQRRCIRLSLCLYYVECKSKNLT